MKKTLILLIIITMFFYTYQNWTVSKNGPFENIGQDNSEVLKEPLQDLINVDGKTVRERIKAPEGFERVEAGEGSFGNYLRNLPLKPYGSRVRYFNGEEKTRDVYEAVVDMEIGDRDLQQCADAVIRLRAEYLYQREQYEKIHFNFVNGFFADYSTWMQGNRIAVNGNQVSWEKRTGYTKDYESFRKYLDMVFAYAGTASLAKELNQTLLEEMIIGDVFIQGGSPGHCVIIIDMAKNKSTGETAFLLAQSYMPAQDIHILKNPRNEVLSPWYVLNIEEILITPEWEFNKEDLKRFE